MICARMGQSSFCGVERRKEAADVNVCAKAVAESGSLGIVLPSRVEGEEVD